MTRTPPTKTLLESISAQVQAAAPQAEILPKRSALDLQIDEVWHRLVFATTNPIRLHYARRLVALRRERDP